MSKILNEKQKLAAVMLLSGFKLGEIATRLRLNIKTVCRWKALPHFQEYAADLKLQSREALKNRIFYLVEDTVAYLSNAMRQEWRPERQAKLAIDALKLLSSTNIMSHTAAETPGQAPRAVSPAGHEFVTPEMPGVAESGRWLVPVQEARAAHEGKVSGPEGTIV